MYSSNQRKYSRSRKAGKRRTKDFNPRSKTNNKLAIYNDPGRFAPDRLRCRLVWLDTTFTRTVTSSNALNFGWRSSAYDPDPAALTGSIPGFAELANLYSLYQVKSMKAEIEVSNQNTEAVIITSWPSNVLQNTNSLTQAEIAEYSGNIRSVSKVCASTNGMNKCTLNVLASGLQLIGPKFNTDLDYSASTSSNPAEMFFINVGMLNPYGNFTYAMLVRAKLIFEVEFFRLRQLES